MEEWKEPYIEQQNTEDALYTKLQRQTLEEIQRLSGKVWTDYNVHDPGVTLADAANYALTELDYKLGFPLTDYLTGENGELDMRRFGLYLPEEVYTTTPVTEEDYRRLFLARIPELANVAVTANTETGGYTIRLIPSPFEEGKECEKLEEQVLKVYHSHRNLCEYPEKVETVRMEELDFQADLEIEAGEDASDVLARLYMKILEYLLQAPVICTPDENKEGLPPEVWLEGQDDTIRIMFPEQQNTEHELYGMLCKVKGVHAFKTCYLNLKGKPQNDFSKGFGLHIPEKEEEIGVHIRQGKHKAYIDFDRFRNRLETLYRIKEHLRKRKADTSAKTSGWPQPSGTYRDVYTHYPIANDFPSCYRLSTDGETTSSFEAYVKLYDKVIEDGLKEVKELPRIMSLSEKDTDILSEEHAKGLKRQYLDFLDRIYGVESQPAWLYEQNSYGETEEGTLRRRMHFLKHAADLTRNRCRARDITDTKGETDNCTPVVKKWFCLMLGINYDDRHAVSNVLPEHNLIISEKKEDRPFMDIDSLLIHERMLDAENVENIDYMELAPDEDGKLEEYRQMRSELDMFNENRISGDLFRGGTDLDNFRIVNAGEGQHLLVYRNREHMGWTNLGCSNNKDRLTKLANILRRFLRELNRSCETVYIVEPVLADKSRPFQLIAVLPVWTARFHTTRFRESCRNLLRSLLPAHLNGTVYWLDERDMRRFERCYHPWMRSLADTRMEEYRKKLLEAICEIVETAVEKQNLYDTY